MADLSHVDKRIIDWLELLGAKTQYESSSFDSSARLKRKSTAIDDATPISKRARIAQLSLTPSQSGIGRQDNASEATESSTRTTTNASRSRSSNPTKRKHQLILASPSISILERKELLAREPELEQTIPGLKSLLQTIKGAQASLPASLEVRHSSFLRWQYLVLTLLGFLALASR